ncbi:MAG: glycine--tRNA ligase [Candidatus Pacebacteria bacterium]|nr:glycine--tRNA ligase [Candidatus Paceibacterota bacterium]
MEKIISLCKRRGFVFPGSEIYGGMANSWDYGPLGVELKNNIKNLWWKKFVSERDDMVGLDAALIMNPKVWEASGHLANFTDPLVECSICKDRFRFDVIQAQEPSNSDGTYNCPNSKASNIKLGESKHHGILSKPRQFNLMLKTFIGPAEESANVAYFRPETAQAIFTNFKNVLQTSRKTLPFGIAQVGKAFRNEITPGNFIFRTREFEQMEIEYFIRESDWKKYFEMLVGLMREWISEVGINSKDVEEIEVKDLAHYSKRTVDFEYKFPFGQKELYGLAYRGDFDLSNHQKFSGENLEYKEEETEKPFIPHVIEPSLGVDRTLLAVLCSAYDDSDGERLVLKLKPKLAPFKAAVFPLLRNKPELVELARKVYLDLKKKFNVAWDDRGNIGKRYYSQDEIGTPYCITVDFDSLTDTSVTVRERDSAKQERIKIGELESFISKSLE